MNDNDNLIYLPSDKISSIMSHSENFRLISEFTANISSKAEADYIYLNEAFRTRKEKMIRESQIVQQSSKVIFICSDCVSRIIFTSFMNDN